MTFIINLNLAAKVSWHSSAQDRMCGNVFVFHYLRTCSFSGFIPVNLNTGAQTPLGVAWLSPQKGNEPKSAARRTESLAKVDELENEFVGCVEFLLAHLGLFVVKPAISNPPASVDPCSRLFGRSSRPA